MTDEEADSPVSWLLERESTRRDDSFPIAGGIAPAAGGGLGWDGGPHEYTSKIPAQGRVLTYSTLGDSSREEITTSGISAIAPVTAIHMQRRINTYTNLEQYVIFRGGKSDGSSSIMLAI